MDDRTRAEWIAEGADVRVAGYSWDGGRQVLIVPMTTGDRGVTVLATFVLQNSFRDEVAKQVPVDVRDAVLEWVDWRSGRDEDRGGWREAGSRDRTER